jgi:hypothetical protein
MAQKSLLMSPSGHEMKSSIRASLVRSSPPSAIALAQTPQVVRGISAQAHGEPQRMTPLLIAVLPLRQAKAVAKILPSSLILPL